MAQLIDRRPNAKNKSTVNRQRFLRRYKKQIKKAIADQISQRSITDMEGGENVTIPAGDISEPAFRHDAGGTRDTVYPGNREFIQGDRISRPLNQGEGKDRRASDSGEGEDDFVFELSRDEYLDMLFDDLELPNLKKNQLRKMTKSKTVRAGYTSNGVPTNINVVRSLRSALSRRIALGSGPRRQLHELQAELEALQQEKNPDESRLTLLNQDTKDIAKRFYILLYLFLTRSYKDVEVVYIRHHTQATEVDEEEFFYSRETGGTIVSSALKLMSDIISDRYPPTDWNIYAAQASDGDNWDDDSPLCQKILSHDLLPLLRYFAYVEITQREHQNLWTHYQHLAASYDNFSMKHIRQQSDIYPVFREFFHKQTA